jgi:hypothetical protein
MIDYLLKFDTQEQAVQFGLDNGFVSFDEDGNPVTTLATHTYALAVLGPWIHQIGTGQDGNPIFESDGKHWVMFRDLVGLPIPTGAEQFIFWDSDLGPRPEDCPNMMWA